MASVFQVSQGTPVVLMSNRTDEQIESGTRLPCLVQVERASSVQVLIDSKDRLNATDDPFRFMVDLTTNLYRGRSIQATKCIMPKLPNVTVKNNELVIKHALGTTATFTLQPAFYNTSSLANALTAAINAAFVAAGIVDSVVTSFDTVTRTFSISSVGGLNFFISDACTFITRGRFLAPFESEPIANAPSKSVIYSSAAGMTYTRYVSVHSRSLNQYCFGQSLTTSFDQQSNIVCLLDVANIDSPEDFDPTKAYAGVYKSMELAYAPQITIVNQQRNIHTIHDFRCLDEYGFDLQDIMNLGAPYPANELGISLYFNVRF